MIKGAVILVHLFNPAQPSVIKRTEGLDLVALMNLRTKVSWCLIKIDMRYFAAHLQIFRILMVTAEVTQYTVADMDTFADIEQRSLRVIKIIDAGTRRQTIYLFGIQQYGQRRSL